MLRKTIGSTLFHRLKTLQQRGSVFLGVKCWRDPFEKNRKNAACDNLPPKLNYKFLTMDDMLIPSGSWKEHYTKRNRHYNGVFLLGIVSLIGSIIVAKETLFFNALPPPYPFEDNQCKCEC